MKKFILFLFLAISTVVGKAQVDTTHGECGTSPSEVAKSNDEAWGRIAVQATDPFTPIGSFPPGGIQTCGVFKIYYEDFAFSVGFFEPTGNLGVDRRNTFCAVLTYVQSVLQTQI